VNTSSAAGLVGLASGNVGYSASKQGVIGLTKSAARAYARSGVRVNAVCPGYLRMPAIEAPSADRGPELETGLVATEPVVRLGSPEEVAELVVWLCTDAASFVTGASGRRRVHRSVKAILGYSWLNTSRAGPATVAAALTAGRSGSLAGLADS